VSATAAKSAYGLDVDPRTLAAVPTAERNRAADRNRS